MIALCITEALALWSTENSTLLIVRDDMALEADRVVRLVVGLVELEFL